MKTQTQTTYPTTLALLLTALACHGAVLDFESVNGTVPIEGMSISNQFLGHFGMSFRRGDGGFPQIAKRGLPLAGFVLSNFTAYDTLDASDPRANVFGEFFLVDDGIFSSTRRTIIDFAAPVAQVSGYIFDVDGSESYTFFAYSDDGTNLVDQVTIRAGDPETGDGRSTPWGFARATNDIRQIRIDPGGSDYNFGLDSITCSYTPPPQQPASLELHSYAGITIQGEVGRPYQIEYTNRLTSGSWIPLTNFYLPASPFLFIDTDSAGQPQRFYKVVGTP
jgi:hypothetical protein